MGVRTWRSMHMQSTLDITPPWFGAHESLWKKKFRTLRHLNLTWPSICRHKLQWTNSGTISGFDTR